MIGEKTMASIKESANNYESTRTKNIAELTKVSTSLEIIERVFKEGTADEFRINVIVVEGNDYRVPSTVLSSLKEILAIKPDLEFFRVTKTGSDLQTKYTTIPL